MRYLRIRRRGRGDEVMEISREDALGYLAGGKKPGAAAQQRLVALEAGEKIDPKYATGFELAVRDD